MTTRLSDGLGRALCLCLLQPLTTAVLRLFVSSSWSRRLSWSHFVRLASHIVLALAQHALRPRRPLARPAQRRQRQRGQRGRLWRHRAGPSLDSSASLTAQIAAQIEQALAANRAAAAAGPAAAEGAAKGGPRLAAGASDALACST